MVNISAPDSMAIVSEVFLGGVYWLPSIIVDGHYAYVSCAEDGLRIYDISMPEHPDLIAEQNTYCSATDADISGDYIYVTGLDKIAVFDISDPTTPSFVDTITILGPAHCIAAHETYNYVYVGGNGSLEIINTSPAIIPGLPFHPDFVGWVDTPGYARAVAVSGDYAYVADGEYGIQEINISIPAAPAISGTQDTDGNARDIVIEGNLAFVADYHAGLQIIDISTYTFLDLIGTVDTPGYAVGVAVAGTYVYVADSEFGLQVIDASTPSWPNIVGTQDTPGIATDVAIDGTYAYVADEWAGLQVVDISIPSSPNLVASLETTGYAWGAAVYGNYVYLANSNGLQVIDISLPTAPSIVSSINTYPVASVGILGNYAYLSICWLGVQIVDISTPTFPLTVGSFNPLQNAADLTFSSNYILIAGGPSGLQIAWRHCALGASIITMPLDHISFALFQDENESQDLTIYNRGDIELIWSLTIQDEAQKSLNINGGGGDISVVDGNNITNQVLVKNNAHKETSLLYGGCPWLTANPSNGTVDSNDSQVIQITADAMGLAPGTYSCQIIIESNAQDEPILTLMVEITVRDPCAIPADDPSKPSAFYLFGNYPNPFNPKTVICFKIPRTTPVGLHVYDLSGRRVRTLIDNATVDLGSHEAIWNGHDDNGQKMASGTYFYRLTAGDYVETKRMTLIR